MVAAGDAKTARRLAALLRRLEGGPAGKPGGGGGPGTALIALALERGLIEQGAGETWRLAEAGRAWLRRRSGGEDPFRAQHGAIGSEIVERDGRRQRVRVDHAESPLTRLYRRRAKDGKPLISADQFAAGERLRRDFTQASLMPSVTSRWEPVANQEKRRSGETRGAADILDSAIAARERVNRALSAVGPEFAGVLVDVCCFLKGLEEVERVNGWPVRSGKLILQLALTALARHYGYGTHAGHRRAGGIRHWGADGFRPRIQD